MSDYDYEQEYQYDEEPQAEEEDISTRVQLDYFQIQDLIRAGKMEKAIQDLQNLYTVCEENNLKNYKIKILNQLLTIYSKNNQVEKLRKTLARISELNKQEKYTQNTVKAILTIVRGSNYGNVKKQLLQFIDQFDQEIRLKSYLFLLERAIDENDKAECQSIFSSVQDTINETEDISASILLEFYSLQIKYSKQLGLNISDKIRQMELKIPKLEGEAYMSQGHISVLKLAFAQIMFQAGNYENSAVNIFQAFLEKSKYGSSGQLKQILKTNALICLLIEDPSLRKKDTISSLYHDSSIPFKNQTEIQHLISLIDAYERHDIDELNRLFKLVNFKPQNKIYESIHQLLLFNIKKQKLVQLLKSYQTIKFSYVGRRLSLNEREVQRIIFELIADEKIHGRIHDVNVEHKYLQILPPRNSFLEIQAENLRELGRRFLS